MNILTDKERAEIVQRMGAYEPLTHTQCDRLLDHIEALEGRPFVVSHGANCVKVPHTGLGYLHGDDDDTPYDVDGVSYCGRCHTAL